MACRTCCKQKQGSRTSNNFTCQTRPTKSYLSRNLSKQVTCHISGHQSRTSWLTTPCKKRIALVLIDGLWRMPLWQDSAHPRVLRSGTEIAGTLRPQLTISAADNEFLGTLIACPCQRFPIQGSPYQLSAPPANEFLGTQSACPCQRLPSRGSPYQLSFPIRGSPYKLSFPIQGSPY